MTTRHLAALVGFAFIATWIALSFGYALLCLLGAAVFYALAAVVDGGVDLGEVQARVTQQQLGRDRARRAAPVRRTRVQ
jgi:tetrahydromethanopterin S-methyltransferase subunit E